MKHVDVVFSSGKVEQISAYNVYIDLDMLIIEYSDGTPYGVNRDTINLNYVQELHIYGGIE